MSGADSSSDARCARRRRTAVLPSRGCSAEARRAPYAVTEARRAPGTCEPTLDAVDARRPVISLFPAAASTFPEICGTGGARRRILSAAALPPTPSLSTACMMPQYGPALGRAGSHDTRTSSSAPGGRVARSGSTRNPSSRGMRSKRTCCVTGVSLRRRSGTVLLPPTRVVVNRSSGASSDPLPSRSVNGAVSRPIFGAFPSFVATASLADIACIDDDDVMVVADCDSPRRPAFSLSISGPAANEGGG